MRRGIRPLIVIIAFVILPSRLDRRTLSLAFAFAFAQGILLCAALVLLAVICAIVRSARSRARSSARRVSGWICRA